MGLMRTLVNVAVGVAIAKGMQAMTGRGRSGGSTGGGLGGALGNILTGGTATAGRGTPYGRGAGQTGLEGMMDGILGRGRNSSRAPRANAPKGGLDELLHGTSSGRRTGGGIGGLFGGVAGGAIGAGTAPRTLPEPREDTLEAALLLRCMIQAAKCDGDLDADEKARLMEAVGQAEPSEIEFVNAELAASVDIDGLVRQIPTGLEEKAYLVSLMAINLDQQAEAEYLHRLATALEMTEAEVNALHDQVNAPRIYN